MSKQRSESAPKTRFGSSLVLPYRRTTFQQLNRQHMLHYFEAITDFSEASWDEAVRSVFPAEMQRLDQDTLDRLLKKVLTQLPHEERELVVESLGKIAKSVGKFAVQNAGTIGTIGGAVAGGIVGGPAGAAMGASLGGTIGGSIQQGAQPRRTARPVNPNPVQQHPAPRPPVQPAPRPPAQQGAVRQQSPELRPVMLANNPQYLSNLIQTIVARTLNSMMQGQRTQLPTNAEQYSSRVIEAFSNAISVYAEETAILHSQATVAPMEQGASLSPKERADQLLVEIYS